jgi:hypothetical protein
LLNAFEVEATRETKLKFIFFLVLLVNGVAANEILDFAKVRVKNKNSQKRARLNFCLRALVLIEKLPATGGPA